MKGHSWHNSSIIGCNRGIHTVDITADPLITLTYTTKLPWRWFQARWHLGSCRGWQDLGSHLANFLLYELIDPCIGRYLATLHVALILSMPDHDNHFQLHLHKCTYMYYSSFVFFQVFTTLKFGESSSTWDLCEANCHQHNYTKNIFVVSVICLGMTHTCTKWIDSYLTLFSPVTIVFLCTNPIVAAQPSGHASMPNYTNINCLPSFFEGWGGGG